jgi:hypothetical protein
MKVGIELRIDVTKIEKARIYNGQKGKYLTMTAFVDLDQKDQYDNNGMITHAKMEGEERAPILGNAKVFWTDGQQQQPVQHQPAQQQAQQAQTPPGYNPSQPQGVSQPQQPQDDYDPDSIPF